MSVAPDPALVEFAPDAADTPAAASRFDCPLCGTVFSHGHLACGGCPLNAGCDILKCPHCGYQFPRSSRLVEMAKRLLRVGGSRSGR